MPIWSEILKELGKTKINGRPNYDHVRRKYLVALHQHTKRDVILYASGWLQKPDAPSSLSAIGSEDIQALMEVVHGLKSRKLDLILHSPGGIPEAAEAIVSYLRSRFPEIRVIVPQLAMSAATMIACAADEIVLGEHSFLGPTDSQIQFRGHLVPAQAILDQFDLAKQECSDPQKISAWLPLLNQYTPGLLTQCESALDLSKNLVKTWLETYMFGNLKDPSEKAKEVSDWLADHKNFKSHNRHLPRTEIEKKGLKVIHLENDKTYQDLCLSVFHATNILFGEAPAVKVVENHLGRAFIKHYRVNTLPAQKIKIAKQIESPQK